MPIFISSAFLHRHQSPSPPNHQRLPPHPSSSQHHLQHHYYYYHWEAANKLEHYFCGNRDDNFGKGVENELIADIMGSVGSEQKDIVSYQVSEEDDGSLRVTSEAPAVSIAA